MVSWSSRWRTNHRWWIAQSPPSARSCHFSRSGKWHVSWQLYTEFLVGSQWRLLEAFPIPFIWLHANQPPVHCSGCLRTNKRLLIFSVLCLSVYFSSNCLLNNSHSGCVGGGVSCSLSLSVAVCSCSFLYLGSTALTIVPVWLGKGSGGTYCLTLSILSLILWLFCLVTNAQHRHALVAW